MLIPVLLSCYSGSRLRTAAIRNLPQLTLKILRAKSQTPFCKWELPPESALYVEHMLQEWKRDPNSVHSSWRAYFEISNGNADVEIFTPLGNLPQHAHFENYTTDQVPKDEVKDYMELQLLVSAYQNRGHLLAKLDPLEILKPDTDSIPELKPSTYGFNEASLSRSFNLGEGVLPEFRNFGITKLTLGEIIQHLNRIYASSTAIEISHLTDKKEINWIKAMIEIPVGNTFTKEEKLIILNNLIKSDTFERFMATKFPTEKRFGLEGCESLIPAMQEVVNYSINTDTEPVDSIVIGMPHRGRLNVLSNVLHKQNQSILAELSHSSPDAVEGSGDVKYHLGMNFSYMTKDNRGIHLSLVANPSHLESVNPVVLGKTRATQFHHNDTSRLKTLSILVHGDAAFSAQGVVYESMGLSSLPSYTVGGTVHIIVNNQIGFTTDPRFARSSPYCSDVAKVIPSPIIHINGEDVEEVVRAARLAAQWRHEWKRDVVLDIICYRRHGHNEVDQPSFTQPLMYKKIGQMEPVLSKYIDKLLKENVITKEEVEEKKKREWDELEKHLTESSVYKPTSKEWVSKTWPDTLSPSELAGVIVPAMKTGVPVEKLKLIGERIHNMPKPFTIHNLLNRVITAREKSVRSGKNIDMPTAESLCLGSLLVENIHVRLSGQDVERGTFSQRHAIIHDQVNESTYIPLNNVAKDDCKIFNKQAHFTVCNSSLSEYGVLGYELGYSLVTPRQLVIWEAQFGDFANTAQCIIDQYICCGEQKWLQRNGLVLMLPHGYDGQGPEHSSGHIERFLQLTDEDPFTYPSLNPKDPKTFFRTQQDCNMRIVYPTTPGNLFHVLRRQVTGHIFKPLILFESKSLLRNPLARSDIEEMGENKLFQRVIPEIMHPNPLECMTSMKVIINNEEVNWKASNDNPRVPYDLASAFPGFELLPKDKTKILIFCTGQVYYQLLKTRAFNNVTDTAIVRIEQLSPFPFVEVKNIIDFYGESLEEVIWCQEEALNHGPWYFVNPRITTSILNSNWYSSGKAQESSKKLLNSIIVGGLSNALGPNQTYKPGTSIRGGVYLRYAGRDPSAAPATGSSFYHKFEEDMLLSEALMKGKLIPPMRYQKSSPVFI